MHRRSFALFILLVAILIPYPPAAEAAALPLAQDEPQPFPYDAQSTSGPQPGPAAVYPEAVAPGPEAVVIPGVPAYLWRHGCGPTAAGMVIGYWDAHGFDWLVEGDAATQTSAVNEMMASTTGSANHYTDYILPIDRQPGGLSPDRSEPPEGDEHPSDSLADFMKTSWSSQGNYYGWSWFSDVAPALEGYTNLVKPAGYQPVTQNLTMFDGSLTWDVYRAEIVAGRPVVLLVDTEGDGVTDHFITAIGYDDSAGVRRYAAYDTWDRQVHWYEFRKLAKGIPYGIYGGTTFRIDPPPSGTSLRICMEEEPKSLNLFSEEMNLAAGLILSAIYDGPIDYRSDGPHPVILERLPDFENGLALERTVTVSPGALIVDASGNVVRLEPGVRYRPVGCGASACEQTYSGGSVQMSQVQSLYPLLPGLVWSDGEPLTASDSVFSFQLSAYSGVPDVPLAKKALAERTESYLAEGGSLVWTGLPGYQPDDLAQLFWIPLPEHAWSGLTLLGHPIGETEESLPLGWGAFRILSWVPGEALALEKNPLYFRNAEGLPFFDRLVFHFSIDPLEGLLSGECDISPDLTADLATLQEYANQGWLKFAPLDELWEDLFSTWIGAGIDPLTASSQIRAAAVAPHIYLPNPDLTGWLFQDLEAVRIGLEQTFSRDGGELVSPDDALHYSFPPGLFASPVTFTHIPRSPLSLPLSGGFKGAGPYFENKAVGLLASSSVLSQPYELEIHFTREELDSLPASGLGLYFWDGSDWVLEPSGEMNLQENTLTAHPQRFGLWAVLAVEAVEGQVIYLPQVGGW